ncbi:L,D-transpeptidase family protein [Micromonospora sp. NPDC049559]|uniref:L,D-transpeptidase n=1 Tax=Micromonospora sp. NPDC049559 TaxID=3155923 RepID=UPI00343CCDBD
MAFVQFRRPAGTPGGRTRQRVLLAGGWLGLLGAALVLTLVLAPTIEPPEQPLGPRPHAAEAPASPATSRAAEERPLPAAQPPPGLPVIGYGPAPTGFPADPAPLATNRLTEGLHPTRRIALYDAPGGRPRAFLASTISGVKVTLPIVDRRSGWVAVLLPSANRRMGWVPPGSWTTELLRDQLVVVRRTHRLTWLRDGAPVRSWPVALGRPSTPTPLGRTFILGRSTLAGRVYAGTDVFALGAVPDNLGSVKTALRGAHIGLHTWYNDRDLGRNTTNGCIRLTRSAQRLLLAELLPGTPLVVLDQPIPLATAPPRDRSAIGPRGD